MTAWNAIQPEDFGDFESPLRPDPIVFHYSVDTARRWHGRPVSDWLALWAYGTVSTTFVMTLVLVMANFPRT